MSRANDFAQLSSCGNDRSRYLLVLAQMRAITMNFRDLRTGCAVAFAI